jgi:hypothetical protein
MADMAGFMQEEENKKLEKFLNSTKISLRLSDPFKQTYRVCFFIDDIDKYIFFEFKEEDLSLDVFSFYKKFVKPCIESVQKHLEETEYTSTICECCGHAQTQVIKDE